MAPVQRRAQRALAGGRIGRAGTERRERVGEPGGESGGIEHAEAGGGELDRQRVPAEAAAQVLDRGPVVVGECVAARGGTALEQPRGSGLGQRRAVLADARAEVAVGGERVRLPAEPVESASICWPRRRSRSGCSATSASSSEASGACSWRARSASTRSSSASTRNSSRRRTSACANAS